MRLFSKTTTTEWNIEGMTCDNCAQHVQKAMAATPGVKNADVDLHAKRATVTQKEGTDSAAIVAAVEAAGYHATLVS